MCKLLCILFCLFVIGQLNAQQLLFVNKPQNKIVTVNIGCKLMLSYVGYNYQTEFCQNTVTGITDSTITLGCGLLGGNTKKNSLKINNCKTIKIKDIIAFRKRSALAEICKHTLYVSTAITSIVLLRNLYTKSNFSTLSALGVSIASGVIINKGISLLFPEDAKYLVSNNWEIRFVKE